MAKEINIGGGKLYLSRVTSYDGLTATTYDTEFEVGYVKNFTVNADTESFEVMHTDGPFEQLVDEVTSKFIAGITFDSINMAAQNIAIALMGKETAAGTGQDNEVEIGTATKNEFKVRFASDYASGINKDATFYRVNLRASGDVPLQSVGAEASVSYSGKVQIDESVVNSGGESQYGKITYRGTAL